MHSSSRLPRAHSSRDRVLWGRSGFGAAAPFQSHCARSPTPRFYTTAGVRLSSVRERNLVPDRPRRWAGPPDQWAGSTVLGPGGIPGSGSPCPALPAGSLCPYKSRGVRWGKRSLPLSAPSSPLPGRCVSPLLQISRPRKRGGRNGFQLRGGLHRGRGKVPRPRPPQQQHHAHRRGRVAQDDAEEVARVSVGAVRLSPRARCQVRLRAGHPRRLLQVPLPPQQLPGQRPGEAPLFTSFTGRRQRGAAASGLAVLVLRHGRGAVTQIQASTSRIKNA